MKDISTPPSYWMWGRAVVDADSQYDMITQFFYIPQQIKRIERDISVGWPEQTATHVKI